MAFYGTLAGALAYHEARGNVAWSAGSVTDPQREAALLRGSEALDGIYGPPLPGKEGKPHSRLCLAAHRRR
ncbi:hypothetical protein Sinme_6846 (plasmid) [Sinorhizobium meliloti AK83]|jgi:hypothetical protein|nr:hypothetical protein Sinme_6846 [Sinorhizobium meliloti AK83]SEJ67410.1 hypothetical protein SAMN04244575_05628 [Sinorhizobium meliloti]